MKKHLVNDSTLLLEALSKLNSLSGDVMTLFVIDSEKELSDRLRMGMCVADLLRERHCKALLRKSCTPTSNMCVPNKITFFF